MFDETLTIRLPEIEHDNAKQYLRGLAAELSSIGIHEVESQKAEDFTALLVGNLDAASLMHLVIHLAEWVVRNGPVKIEITTPNGCRVFAEHCGRSEHDRPSQGDSK